MFRSAFASGDCCTPALPWGDLPIAAFLARCQVAAAEGLAIRDLARTDLIRMRHALGGPTNLRGPTELGRLEWLPARSGSVGCLAVCPRAAAPRPCPT